MAKGYWINFFRKVKDPAKVEAYRALAGPVMQASGGKRLSCAAIRRAGALSRGPACGDATAKARMRPADCTGALDPLRGRTYAKGAGTAPPSAGQVYEAGLADRVVVIEFESVQKAIEVHDSPGYQAALKALGDGAERDLRIVEGL